MPYSTTRYMSSSYADDLSINAKSRQKKDLSVQTQKMYQTTAEFISDAGMSINPSKCFTYGDPCVAGNSKKIPQHKDQFRLVGGSVKINKKKGWTEFEQSRANTWKNSVSNIRFLPISRQQKAHMIQSVMSQLTFGHGTHSLHITPQQLTNLCATVIRTLPNADYYDASPCIIFTILAQPSLAPEFAMQVAALQLIFRTLNSPQLKQHVLELILNPNVIFNIDGPLNRMRQLYQHEVYHDTIHSFLNNRFDPHKWQHELRDKFRLAWWKKTAIDRAQHFSGIDRGINRRLSIAYIY